MTQSLRSCDCWVTISDTGLVPISVVLADDHRLTATALADSLRGHGLAIAGIAHSVPEAIELVSSNTPGVLVTDLDMGAGPSGLDLAVRVRRAFPLTGVVVLTAYEDPKLFGPDTPEVPDDVVYLVKHDLGTVEDLLTAVHLAHLYATGAEPVPKRRTRFALTHSQASLLRLVAKGMSNQAIADELTVTPDTVAKSINRLAKRFAISSTDQRNVRVALTQKYFDYIGFQRD